MKELESWGRNPCVQQTVHRVRWRMESLPVAPPNGLLPYGCGRSYGDVCLNSGGTLLHTKDLDRFISFDEEAGHLECESGVTLAEILKLIVPKGWFLPVTPGTKFVTVGGCIANDVHGKNHHRAGTFGRYVRRLELLRSDGRRLLASPTDNLEWFEATLGGLGLTGLILSAQLQLRRIPSAYLFKETVPFRSLGEFFELSRATDAEYEYTVAWLDCVSSGRHFGRGLLFRANHASVTEEGLSSSRKRRAPLKVPFDFPSFVLNPLSIRAFNGLYFHAHRRQTKQRLTHYDSFFYPLDAIGSWNKIYGRRGFFQFQCVLPMENGPQSIEALLHEIVRSGSGSFLAVLKTLGELPSAGLMSFARPGITLALDFANRGEETVDLLRALDRFTRERGGAVYPAKDAVMEQGSFATYFPAQDRFSAFLDPAFSSSFWRRVNGLSEPSLP